MANDENAFALWHPRNRCTPTAKHLYPDVNQRTNKLNSRARQASTRTITTERSAYIALISNFRQLIHPALKNIKVTTRKSKTVPENPVNKIISIVSLENIFKNSKARKQTLYHPQTTGTQRTKIQNSKIRQKQVWPSKVFFECTVKKYRYIESIALPQSREVQEALTPLGLD